MKVKTISSEIIGIVENDDFLYSYIRDMQSEIYQIPIPDYFVGTNFKKLAQMLYLCNVEISLDQANPHQFHQNILGAEMITLIAIETLNDDVPIPSPIFRTSTPWKMRATSPTPPSSSSSSRCGT